MQPRIVGGGVWAEWDTRPVCRAGRVNTVLSDLENGPNLRFAARREWERTARDRRDTENHVLWHHLYIVKPRG